MKEEEDDGAMEDDDEGFTVVAEWTEPPRMEGTTPSTQSDYNSDGAGESGRTSASPLPGKGKITRKARE